MKDMYLYDSLTVTEIKDLIPKKSILFFDTESSFVNENKNIPQRLEDGSFNSEFNTEVHVYAWAISNCNNNNVIYGHNLNTFMDFLHKLELSWFDDKLYKTEETQTVIPALEIWVHNLQWDLEFLKYELEKQKYVYENSKVNKCKEKIHQKISRGHYQIIETTGIVYAATVTHKKAIKVTVAKNKKEVRTELKQININFHDSMKVTNTSLENIALNILTLPKERLKIEGYDYDKHRPIGHPLTEEEQEYLYNDVYILKEWYNQYYYPLATNHKTASGIAFEKICQSVYGMNFSYKNHFLTHFPNVDGYTSKSLIDDSYTGGMTQVNRYYANKVNTFDNNKVSIDIVSSYPSIIVNKPLPIGSPVASYDFINNPIIKDNKEKYLKEIEAYKKDESKLVLLKIGFDAFKNKDKNNLIGFIQLGALNKKEFQENFKHYKNSMKINSGNEYIHTNIIHNNKIIGGNLKHNNYRYVFSYWTFELESILKNSILLQGEQKYCKERECFYLPKSLQLEEGYTILGATVFEAYTGFFADGILEGYNAKNEGKKEGNKIKESINKTYINSFYGKLASNPNRHERYSYYNEETELMDYKRTDIKYQDPRKYYKAMASCVTAWGRCNLRDTLYQVCSYNTNTGLIDGKFHNNVMYMDTDSLWTTLTKEELIKVIPDKLNNTLGSWSLDVEYNRFKAIGSKKYIYHGKKINKEGDLKTTCKCAGLPEAARKTQTFNSFKIGEEIEGKKIKKKVKGGYALLYGTYTISDNIL